MDFAASTARLVSATFASKGSFDPSKTTESKPAFTASTVFSTEWVWSPFTNSVTPRSSWRARISATASRTPVNRRSPSDRPMMTGTPNSLAVWAAAFMTTSSDALKCASATFCALAFRRASRKVGCFMGGAPRGPRRLQNDAPFAPDGALEPGI